MILLPRQSMLSHIISNQTGTYPHFPLHYLNMNMNTESLWICNDYRRI